MNWLDEVRASLYGSWLLLIRDPDALRHFNTTEAGFWRSFSAIIPIAPLYLYAASVQMVLPETPAPAEPSQVMLMIGLVLQWIGWPLALAFIARVAGLAQSYARYIIAYNWSSVLVILAMLPPLMLLDLGAVGPGAAVFMSFVILLLSLYYRWYVAVAALETTGAVAGALVLADVVLSLAINRVFG